MIKRIIDYVENIQAGFSLWLAAFAGLIVVKVFLENFASGTRSGFLTTDTFTIIHYMLWFLGAFLSITMIIYFLTKENIAKIFKFVLLWHLLIWLTTIIDYIWTRGEYYPLAYLYLSPKELIINFFTLGVGNPHVSIGQMIVIPIVVVGVMVYVFFKNQKIVNSVLAGILSYTSIYLWGAIPSIIHLVHQSVSFAPLAKSGREVVAFFAAAVQNPVIRENILRPDVNYTFNSLQQNLQVGILSQVFFLIVVALLGMFAFMLNRQKFKAIIANVRAFGITHYYLTIFLGLLLAKTSPVLKYDWTFFVSFLVLFLSYYFAYMFAMGTNDVFDLGIDEVSNPERPLVTKAVEKKDLNNYNLAFLILGVVGASLLGSIIFYMVLVAVVCSYVYSAPPFRLKKIPFIATFMIALASLSAMMAGFYFLNFTKTISSFPPSIIAATILFHLLWGNVKDIKDREGDRAGKIPTLANLFLEPRAKQLVSFLSVAAYVLVGVIVGSRVLLFVGLAAGVVTLVLINKKNYSHYAVFAVYFAFLMVCSVLASQIQ